MKVWRLFSRPAIAVAPPVATGTENMVLDGLEDLVRGCEAALRACLTIVTGLESGEIILTAAEAVEMRGSLMKHAQTAQQMRELLIQARQTIEQA